MQNVLASLPFNISLLILSDANCRGLRKVSALDIYVTAGNKNFHPDGLFSVETFGKVGDERRNRLFGYMDLNLQVFHPLVFKTIVDLKELYGKIMSGSTYAKFDEKTKDFVQASLTDGETGYAFFMKHFPKLVFEERKSTSREFSIKLVNSNRDDCLIDKLIVMPAGLRDFTITPSGKPEEDEINTLYRQVLSIANVIGTHGGKDDASHLDAMRYRLQTSIVAIYDYIINLLEGKSKLVQGWWTNRSTFYSSRNVITSNVQMSPSRDSATTISPNETVSGLYQALQGIFPVTVNAVRETASRIFQGPNAPALLINKKTLMQESVRVSSEYYDDWMTQDGLESILGEFETDLLRHDPITVGDHYFALIYNDGKSVRIVHGLQDLPEGFDRKYVSPITYAEFFYLTIFEKIKKYPALVSRYPILGLGSIYPSYTYLKTTTKSQSLQVLGEDWKPTGKVANEFPIRGVAFVNSMSPSRAHLPRLGAD